MTRSDPRRVVQRARRIVVKVGSSTLTRNGAVRPQAFTQIAQQVSALADAGREIVLVSSGAIAVGAGTLGWDQPGRSIPQMQAAAAVGQIGLMDLYRRRFARRGRTVAQVLLTRSGLSDRERYLNARHTLQELLRLGVIAIVNENDTVATDEIRFGDNDSLSATLVDLIGADLLVILTDVDGLYQRCPSDDEPHPPLIDLVERITPRLLAAAQGSNSAFGRGGMLTKLEAAKAAARSGAATVVCNGSKRGVLEAVAAGRPVGTLFLPNIGGERLASRKHWLAFTARTRGQIVLDDGASRAVRSRGRSLLPAGIIAVRGRFGIGDSVALVDGAGQELARGLSAYASEDVERIKGAKASAIQQVLGYSNGDAVVHRNDLVVL